MQKVLAQAFATDGAKVVGCESTSTPGAPRRRRCERRAER
jgi:hypothetical protein